jgi:hypothetical protein
LDAEHAGVSEWHPLWRRGHAGLVGVHGGLGWGHPQKRRLAQTAEVKIALLGRNVLNQPLQVQVIGDAGCAWAYALQATSALTN